jgi:hypothetical protein
MNQFITAYFPRFTISVRDLTNYLTNLPNFPIGYDKNKQSGGLRGFFTGVQFNAVNANLLMNGQRLLKIDGTPSDISPL